MTKIHTHDFRTKSCVSVLVITLTHQKRLTCGKKHVNRTELTIYMLFTACQTLSMSESYDQNTYARFRPKSCLSVLVITFTHQKRLTCGKKHVNRTELTIYMLFTA